MEIKLIDISELENLKSEIITDENGEQFFSIICQ